MSFFDRGLLAVYSLVVTILLLIAIPVLSGWWLKPLDILLDAPADPEGSTVLWTAAALLILAGLRLLFVALRSAGERRSVVHEFTLGQVRITLSAIEELVKKAAYQIEGVRDIKPRITSAAGGISINIRAAVSPDINIPEVSKQIQHRVKDYILEITGISVSSVKVTVENISTNRPRVE